jgi:hypothetical protein
MRIIITLDIYEETVTAYNPDGSVIASAKVSVPSIAKDRYNSVADWHASTNYLFNWQMSAGGGVAVDDFKIYTGEYLMP